MIRLPLLGEFNMFEYKKFFDYRSQETTEKIESARLNDSKVFFEKYKGDFQNAPCPICGAQASTDLSKFHNTYSVVRCSRCASAYVNPRPTQAMLSEYYNSAEYIKILRDFYVERAKSSVGKTVVDSRTTLVQKYIHAQPSKKIKILEIGCNSGSFCRSLASVSNVEIHGIDIDEQAIAEAEKYNDSIVYTAASCEDYARANANQFDIIIAWYVVEHLFNPLDFAKSVNAMLAPGGFFIFSTNNYTGLDSVALPYNAERRSLTHIISPPEHLNGFSNDNLKLFAFNAGFNFEKMGSFGQFDMDLLTINKDYVDGELYKKLSEQNETAKGIFQNVVRELCVSGDIYAILSKPR